MQMFGHSCTVYNKYTEGGLDKYRRTVISGVHCESSKGAMLKKSGVSADNGVMIIIPKSADTAGKSFVSNLAWQGTEDKAGIWTLQDGDKVVFGVAEHDIVKTAAELLKLYPDVYTISAVDDNSFGSLAHWEVTAK